MEEIKISYTKRVGYDPTKKSEVTLDLELIQSLDNETLGATIKDQVGKLIEAVDKLPNKPFININPINTNEYYKDIFEAAKPKLNKELTEKVGIIGKCIMLSNTDIDEFAEKISQKIHDKSKRRGPGPL